MYHILSFWASLLGLDSPVTGSCLEDAGMTFFFSTSSVAAIRLTLPANAEQLYTSFRKSVILAGTFKKS